jgi:hypothetical protein
MGKQNFRGSSCVTWKTQEVKRKTKSFGNCLRTRFKIAANETSHETKRLILNATLQERFVRLKDTAKLSAAKKSNETFK